MVLVLGGVRGGVKFCTVAREFVSLFVSVGSVMALDPGDFC